MSANGKLTDLGSWIVLGAVRRQQKGSSILKFRRQCIEVDMRLPCTPGAAISDSLLPQIRVSTRVLRIFD